MPNGIKLSITAREDGTLDAAYVAVSQEKVARSEEIIESVLILDFDSAGGLVGVEILAPVKISDVHQVAKMLEGPTRESFNRFMDTYAPASIVTAG